jgi:hypothetical protein
MAVEQRQIVRRGRIHQVEPAMQKRVGQVIEIAHLLRAQVVSQGSGGKIKQQHQGKDGQRCGEIRIAPSSLAG